jgi:predicted PurR-regulated permease PerM
MRDSQNNSVSNRHLWEIVAAREILLLLLAAVFIWILYFLREIFLPIFVALVLADVFNPFVTLLERKWRWPRPLTVTLIIVAVLAAIVGFLAWLGPLLFNQFTGLADKLPDYLKTLGKTYGIDFDGLFSQFDVSLRDLQNEPRKILGQIFSTTGRAVGIVSFLFTRATSVIISLLLVVIYFLLFSWRFNEGIAKLSVYVPESRKARVFAIVARMDQAVGDFFRGRLVIAIIVGIALSTGWFLTGVPYWFFLGMLTGLLTIVPYLSVITWPVAIALKYLDALTNSAGQSAGLLAVVVWPSAVYFTILFLEGWVLTPWIQSGQTHMSAATVLLVVFIGGALAGVWGLLFAIPIAACIKILLEELVLPPLRRWAVTH